MTDRPSSGAFAITPSNSANTTYVTRALYVGGAGNITVDMADGQANVLFQAVPVGTVLPIRVRKVKATGTTATFIVGLY